MSFFCGIFGCTWVTKTEAPEVRWNTTKAANVLECSGTGAEEGGEENQLEEQVQFFDQCVRCGATRPSHTKRESAAGG